MKVRKDGEEERRKLRIKGGRSKVNKILRKKERTEDRRILGKRKKEIKVRRNLRNIEEELKREKC